MKWEFAASTDSGRVRYENEDFFSVVHAESGAFVVADGLGGHRAGEIASRIACERVAEGLVGPARRSAIATDVEQFVRDAVQDANTAVLTAAASDPSLKRMGCTFVAARLWESYATIAHIGDARAYLWREGSLAQLTDDHTEVAVLIANQVLTPEEARYYPFRHRVQRALGVNSEVAVEVKTVSLCNRDRLLLCTDGLWGMIDNVRLCEMLGLGRDCRTCLAQMVEDANSAGGSDNITGVIIDIHGSPDGLGF
jgi:serine/threonine protein phosphatase PrpC